MYITDAYARILCSKCKKQVAILMPGEVFNGIPQCECNIPKASPKKATRKTVPKAEEDKC